MINRPLFENRIRTALDRSPVVALVGPRQVGKTTLARQFVAPDSSNYFDLEDPISLARLAEPMTRFNVLATYFRCCACLLTGPNHMARKHVS